MLRYILTADSLSIFLQGRQRTIQRHDARWDEAMDLLRANADDEAFVQLLEPATIVQQALTKMGSDEVRLEGGRLYIGDEPADENEDYAVRQILKFHAQGLPTEPLVNFYHRLRANPSFRVRRDLLQFLEHGKLPITEDGCSMAYKRVTGEFKDVHTGTVDYTPPRVVEMPRHMVDDDPNNTCSAGLHVCSYDYLINFDGAKCLAIKIDPADVVSIPTDYHNTKMRVCRLEVVEEIPQPETHNVWGSPVVHMSAGTLIASSRHVEPEDEEDQYDEDEAAEEEEDDDYRTCEKCGQTQIDDDHLFCHACGHELGEPFIPQTEKFREGDKVRVRDHNGWSTKAEIVFVEPRLSGETEWRYLVSDTGPLFPSGQPIAEEHLRAESEFEQPSETPVPVPDYTQPEFDVGDRVWVASVIPGQVSDVLTAGVITNARQEPGGWKFSVLTSPVVEPGEYWGHQLTTRITD